MVIGFLVVLLCLTDARQELEGEDEYVDRIYGSIKGRWRLLVLLACVGYLLYFLQQPLNGIWRAWSRGRSETVFGGCLSGLPSSAIFG